MPGVFLLILIALAIPIVGIWLVVRAVESTRQLDQLNLRISNLERELHRLRKQAITPETAPQPTAAQPASEPKPTAPPEPIQLTTPVISPREPAPAHVTAVPPPLPAAPKTADSTPQVTPPPPMPTPRLMPLPTPVTIDWEQFMGVKLFAWIGGLALFLGVVFFVKYSFEHNWISPELRIGVGFLTGIGLLIGGIRMSKKDYPTLAQTLCATGIVILYAVTYSARSFYHFGFFDTPRTFLLMVLITAAAFGMAVRYDALVVAILGMCGGFLTPILVRTGQDNPLGLFGYLAILNIGLLAVAAKRRWDFLPALAAAGTALLQAAWANEFFVSERYSEGNRTLIPMAVLLGFCLLYLGAAWQAHRAGKLSWWLSGSVLGLVAVALCFALWFLDFATLAARPILLFGFVLLIDLVVTALRWFDRQCGPADSVVGFAVFLLLALWTGNSLQPALLNIALALYLAFAIVHTALPLLRRRRQAETGTAGLPQLFAPLALILILIPVFRLAELSLVVWPVILLIDLLAIGLAILSAALLPVLGVLILSLTAIAGILLKVPPSLDGFGTFLILLAFFSTFFIGVGLWLTRRFRPPILQNGLKFGDDLTEPQDAAALIPLCSAVLPFALLILATVQLKLTNPTPAFGLALLLVFMLLALTRLFLADALPAIALACVAALEWTWHLNHFSAADAIVPLAWYLGFHAAFTLFPFLFIRQPGSPLPSGEGSGVRAFSERVLPWAVAAFAGVPQFFLVHRLVREAYPNQVMGLLPAAFALPPLAGLLFALKRAITSSKTRLAQLAWFGGVTLFFVTLIFPIQFHKQWLTLAWALEGAALLWLFRRVPHPGLKATGIALLVIAFTRLTLNVAVLDYERRSATPVFNWYLYTYGIVTVCLFAGATLATSSKDRFIPFNPRALLICLGTILAFALLNVEIFDAFTPPGGRIELEFSGNFSRDMTFSIAWAAFALVLLIVGIAKRQRAFRYAGLSLLSLTLLKLFFHDLAQLKQLHRIGAFVAVAVIAMAASFAYQKFFASALKKSEP